MGRTPRGRGMASEGGGARAALGERRLESELVRDLGCPARQGLDAEALESFREAGSLAAGSGLPGLAAGAAVNAVVVASRPTGTPPPAGLVEVARGRVAVLASPGERVPHRLGLAWCFLREARRSAEAEAEAGAGGRTEWLRRAHGEASEALESAEKAGLGVATARATVIPGRIRFEADAGVGGPRPGAAGGVRRAAGRGGRGGVPGALAGGAPAAGGRGIRGVDPGVPWSRRDLPDHPAGCDPEFPAEPRRPVVPRGTRSVVLRMGRPPGAGGGSGDQPGRARSPAGRGAGRHRAVQDRGEAGAVAGQLLPPTGRVSCRGRRWRRGRRCCTRWSCPTVWSSFSACRRDSSTSPCRCRGRCWSERSGSSGGGWGSCRRPTRSPPRDCTGR